ncbi:hypothetical protein HPB50_012580 [Hyalomma asiaticum]|uniref:Uncharacterized protein n=1 Tax=Hyalomma asiaticum TaxID=266040 RepID=A0ACB7S3A4_HYAAI|nr:hypothetical protein HPB50_012580 [Hyalomma asiaticum]
MHKQAPSGTAAALLLNHRIDEEVPQVAVAVDVVFAMKKDMIDDVVHKGLHEVLCLSSDMCYQCNSDNKTSKYPDFYTNKQLSESRSFSESQQSQECRRTVEPGELMSGLRLT